MLRLFPPLRFLSVKPVLCCSAPHRDVEACSEQSFVAKFQTDERIESVFIRENWTALFSQLSPDDTEHLLTSPAFSRYESSKSKSDSLVVSSDVMDRILSVKPHCEQTAKIWCCMVCRALDTVNHISLNQVESIRETLLINVLHLVSTQVDIFWWCSVVSNCANKCSNGPSVLGVPAVRDALIQLHGKLSDDHSVRAWLACIPNIVDPSDPATKSHHCFATLKMREAVMHVGHLVARHDAAYWWCGCVTSIGIFDRSLFARRDVCELLMNHHSLILAALRDEGPMRQVFITTENYIARWGAAVACVAAECEETYIFFTTETFRDALLSFLSFVASPLSALWWCGVLLNVVEKNPRAQRIFGTAIVFDALLEVEPFATGHDASKSWMNAIAGLCANNRSNKQHFATTEIRRLLLRKFDELHKLDAVTEDWCRTWCAAITHLVVDCPEARCLFATASICKALMSMSHLGKSALTVRWWCSVVTNLVADSHEFDYTAQKLFPRNVKDALLYQASYVTTSDSCRAWSAAVTHLCRDNVENQKAFATPEMRDALMEVRKYATTPLAARWWCSSLVNILSAPVKNVASVLSSPEFCDALITLVTETDFATNDAFTGAWCGAVANLCCRPGLARQRFATPTMREALLTVHPFVRAMSTAGWWCDALSRIVDENLETKAMFGTPEMRDALMSMQPIATRAHGRGAWCAAVAKLCLDAPANQQLFRTTEVRDAFVGQAKFVKEAYQVTWWCAAVSNLAQWEGQTLFATREMHDALVSLASLDLDATSAWRWVGVLFVLTRRNTATQKLFATVLIKDGLLKCRVLLQTDTQRRILSSVTFSLAFSSPAARSCFEDALTVMRRDKR